MASEGNGDVRATPSTSVDMRSTSAPPRLARTHAERARWFEYAAAPSRQSVGWVLVILGTIYCIVPVALIPTFFSGGRAIDWTWVGVAIVATLAALTANIRELLLYKQERWDDFYPLYNFAELCLGIVGALAVSLARPDQLGLYCPIMLLPLVLGAVIFDARGLMTLWVLALVGLATVGAVAGGSATTAFWLTLAFGSVFGITAAAIQIVVGRLFGELHASDSLAVFAHDTNDLDDWHDGMYPNLPALADAMMVDRVAVALRGKNEKGLRDVLMWPEGWIDGDRLIGAASRATRQTLERVDGGAGVGGDSSGRTLTSMWRRDPDVLLAIVGSASQVDVVIVIPAGPSVLGTALNDRTSVTAANLLAGVADRLALIEKLREIAVTDPLTGLPNRRRLFETLANELERSGRTTTTMSVAMIDLDLFKRYNDEHGHQAGDRLLQTFARTVSERIRGQDTMARYGGEEFCLVLPGTDATGAHALLEDMRQAGVTDDDGRRVTFSVGIAGWQGEEGADALIKRADLALYDAKAGGRDRVVVAPDQAALHASP